MHFIRSTSKTKFHKKVEKPGMDKDKEKQRKQDVQALTGLKTDTYTNKRYSLRRYNNDSSWTEQHSFKNHKAKTARNTKIWQGNDKYRHQIFKKFNKLSKLYSLHGVPWTVP